MWPRLSKISNDRRNLLYDKSASFRCSAVRVQQLQMLYHQRCCMSASQCMSSSLWNTVVAHEHRWQDGSRWLGMIYHVLHVRVLLLFGSMVATMLFSDVFACWNTTVLYSWLASLDYCHKHKALDKQKQNWDATFTTNSKNQKQLWPSVSMLLG